MHFSGIWNGVLRVGSAKKIEIKESTVPSDSIWNDDLEVGSAEYFENKNA